jgi:hypothetical protein
MTVGRRVVARRSLLRLVVRVDPNVASPGEYKGVLPIIAGGRVLEKVELTAKVRSQVVSAWWTDVLAAALILLGAAAGALLKWLSETGARLQALENRYERVLAVIGPSRLPKGLRGLLVSIQQALDALDAAHAERQLAQVESQLDAVILAISDVERLSALIAIERRKIDRLSDQDVDRLLGITDSLVQKLDEALDRSWPDPAKHVEDRATLVDEIRLFTAFLAAFSDTGDRDALRPVIGDFERGDMTAARKRMENVAAVEPGLLVIPASREGLIAAGALVAVGTGVQLARRWGRRRRQEPSAVPGDLAAGAEPPRRRGAVARFAVRYTGSIAGAIIAVAVTLVGLTLLYFPNETFGSALDWLTLILWGFGVQLGGFSLAQLGGRALAGGPKITEPQRT